ncbi:MAG: extracellular solute-binding protein, partial [Clostridia bacterium]|nr:extracellular solute-binding protein [Clostridia bacterium]
LSEGGVDYDGNGKLSTNEKIRGVLEDKFNPNRSSIAKEFYRNAVTYYKTLRAGWNSTSADTYLNAWRGGNAGMVNQGIWFWNTEKTASHPFEYSLFPTPVLMYDETNSPNASNLERKTLAEGFESGVNVALNIMKDGIKSEKDLENAIDFLMFLTTPEANQQLCAENGQGFPAVKGAEIGNVFVESGWTLRKFTNIYDGEWPFGFTSGYTTLLDDAFGEWYRSNINDASFFTYVNQYQKAGAMQMVNQMEIDTTGWNIV